MSLQKNNSVIFFFSSRRGHTRWNCDWSSDVCSSDLWSRWRRCCVCGGRGGASRESGWRRRRGCAERWRAARSRTTCVGWGVSRGRRRRGWLGRGIWKGWAWEVMGERERCSRQAEKPRWTKTWDGVGEKSLQMEKQNEEKYMREDQKTKTKTMMMKNQDQRSSC